MDATQTGFGEPAWDAAEIQERYARAAAGSPAWQDPTHIARVAEAVTRGALVRYGPGDDLVVDDGLEPQAFVYAATADAAPGGRVTVVALHAFSIAARRALGNEPAPAD